MTSEDKLGISSDLTVLVCKTHCCKQENQSVLQTNTVRSEEMPSLFLLVMAGECFDEVRNAN